MLNSSRRRSLLLAALSLPALSACSTSRSREVSAAGLEAAGRQLDALEQGFTDGRIGVAALDTGSGARLLHRADERFPFCSSFKIMPVCALLARSAKEPDLLSRVIRYRRQDLVINSPVTERHVDTGMSVAALCAAALQYSDNTAANLLIRLVGGTAAVTAYARSIGDGSFRLDRMEIELNESVPGDARDTTTPAATAATLQRVLLGDALDASSRAQLTDWMLGNRVGTARIRAGVPAGWRVADRTGTGAYATANDIAMLYPPLRAPIALAVYTTRERGAADNGDYDEARIAAVARVVVAAFG